MKMHPEEAAYLWNSLSFNIFGVDSNDNEVSQLSAFGAAMVGMGAKSVIYSNQDRIEAAAALREWAAAIKASQK